MGQAVDEKGKRFKAGIGEGIQIIQRVVGAHKLALVYQLMQGQRQIKIAHDAVVRHKIQKLRMRAAAQLPERQQRVELSVRFIQQRRLIG